METPNPNSSDREDTSTERGRIVHQPNLRDIISFTAGDRVFAVFAAQVEGTAETKVPARSPRAMNAVLGVVCVRGRMLTVLDPLALVTGQALNWSGSLPCVIALSGDEQLALAAETCRDKVTIDEDDIERAGEDGNAGGPAIGLIRYGGEEITMLDPGRLFDSVMQRRERRRRRL